ncbi:glycoside hydrolase family 16 protein [Luteococcus sp. Sow4_B9]|uniref:glycoside hydrolase family 16 protein n=1 Tax=Luteococcus sp. Sow4_B9 TaxID=3438792 RepID=UPI003F9CC4FF
MTTHRPLLRSRLRRGLSASAALIMALALQPGAAAEAKAEPTATAWADFRTPVPWNAEKDDVQFYVATPSIGSSQVGQQVTLNAEVPGLDCEAVSLGQSGPRGWSATKSTSATCDGEQAKHTITVDESMVGATVFLNGWAAAEGSPDVTVEGEVQQQSGTQRVKATATGNPNAGKPTTVPTATATPTVAPSPTAQPTIAPSPSAAPSTPTATPTPSPSAPAPTSPVDEKPTFVEEFSSWPAGSNYNANKTLRINGDWQGSGGNMLMRSNVEVANGHATMISRANQKSGAEMQTNPANLVGNGYYETSMQMSATPGILSGMFFIAKDYGFPEVDMEIRSADNGPGKRHSIFYSVHYAGGGHQYKEVFLPFDPSDGFHTYGFLIKQNSISFYADGKHTHTWDNLPTNLGAGSEPQGYLMTNSWAQNSEWVGPLPATDTRTRINWIRHWADVAEPKFTPAQ